MKISENLLLIPLTLNHAPDILCLVEANRGYLQQYLYWVEGVVDLASCERYIDERVNSGLAHAQWFGIEVNEELVGVFAVKSINQHKVAEVGYWLAQSAAGQGVMSRVIASVVAKLSADSVATTLEFGCLEQNTPSIAVALKAGATLSHQINNYIELDGVLQTLKVYRKQL